MGPAGHYYTPYFVSLLAGYPRDVAFQNAFYCQMPDQVQELDAAWLQEDFMKHLSTPKQLNRDLIHRGLHCFTGGNSKTEQVYRKEKTEALAVSPGAGTILFGVSLHPFGDSYAHSMMHEPERMYQTGWGHAVEVMNPRTASDQDLPCVGRGFRTITKDVVRERDIKSGGAKAIEHRERMGHAADAIHRRQPLFHKYVENLFLTLALAPKTGYPGCHLVRNSETSGLSPGEVAQEFAKRVSPFETEDAIIRETIALTQRWMNIEMEDYRPEIQALMPWEKFQEIYQYWDHLGELENTSLEKITERARAWAGPRP